MRSVIISLCVASLVLLGLALNNLQSDAGPAPPPTPGGAETGSTAGTAVGELRPPTGEGDRIAADRVAADRAASARVSGRLLDELGGALPGFELLLAKARQRVLSATASHSDVWSGISAANGTFELTAPAATPLWLAARRPGFGVHVLVRNLNLQAGEQRQLGDLTLPLQPGLCVTVTSAAGRRLRGARVELHRALMSAELPGALSTAIERFADADGVATFFCVPPGPYRLIVAASDHAGTQCTHQQPAEVDEPQRVTVQLGPQAVLIGSVRDAAGNTLVASIDLQPEAAAAGLAAQGRSDVTGQFRIGGLSPGPYRATITAPGHPPLVIGDLRPGQNAVDVQLPAPHELAGRLLRADGSQSVAHATVQLWYEGGWPALVDGRLERRAVKSDEDGRFRLSGLRPGIVFVSVTSDGHAPTTAGPFATVPAGTGARNEIEVRLAAGCRLSGQVLDPTGSPANGAMVEILPDESEAATTEPSQVDHALLDRIVPGRAPLPRVATGPSGRFEIGGVPAGRFRLKIEFPRLPTFLGPAFSTQASHTLRLGSQQLKQGGVVRGQVLRADGSPAAAATVCLERQPDTPSLPSATPALRVQASASGKYEIGPAAPGDYHIFYYYPDLDDAEQAAQRRRTTIRPVQIVERATAAIDLKPR